MLYRMKVLISFVCVVMIVFSGQFLNAGNVSDKDSKIKKNSVKAEKIPKSSDTSDRWAFLPDVLAEVGDKKITKEQFVKNANKMLGRMASSNMKIPQQMLKRMAQNGIKNMIDEMLVLKILDDNGIKPSPELVVKEMNKDYSEFSDKEKKQIDEKLAQKKTSFKEYVKKMSENPDAQKAMAMSAWVREDIAPKINITEEQIEKYYNENQKIFTLPENAQVAHILFKNANALKNKEGEEPSEINAAAKEEAEKALALVKQGKKFAEVAKKNSQCASAPKGGLLPPFDPDGQIQGGRANQKMNKKFVDAAYKLDEGEISGIVETPFGYHIIQMLKKNPEKTMEFNEQLKKELKTFLKRQEEANFIEKAIQAEKKKMEIKNHLK